MLLPRQVASTPLPLPVLPISLPLLTPWIPERKTIALQSWLGFLCKPKQGCYSLLPQTRPPRREPETFPVVRASIIMLVINLPDREPQ